MELAALKEKVTMSNKQWDTSIKTLTKNGLVKVMKTNDVLFVEIV
jgi:lysyl-tRNA synthetase class 2